MVVQLNLSFEEGEEDSSKKMNPDMMLDRLDNLYPGIFSKPSASSIKKKISGLSQAAKKKTASTSATRLRMSVWDEFPP